MSAVRAAVQGNRGSEPRARGGRRLGTSLAYLTLAIIGIFCLIPFSWPILASLDPQAGPYLAVPTQWSLANFGRLLSDPTWLRLLLNCMSLSGGATIVALATSVLGGYALSRFAFRGRRVLLFGILFTRIIPASATIAPLYFIVLRLGLANTYHGVILVEAAQQLPLTLWMMKGFFDTVPRELEEAAWIDGADRLGSAIRIVLPLAMPGVGAAALFAFIAVWGDFLTPLILLQSPDLFPISIGLFRAYIGYNLVDWGELAATSILYMLPAIAFYLLVRRYLLRATVVGALQGT